MVWCSNCSRDVQSEREYATGSICCSECGKVIYQDEFQDEPSFVKGAGGESRVSGNYVRSIQSDYSRSLENGKMQINDLIVKLEISDGSLGDIAKRFYKLALERSFTRGRRTSHVAAACLYTACRANDKPYLLIDFAMWLSVNVYVLGAVYLQLCKLLSLNEHAFVQKPVDPSLFMHRFASALVKDGYERKRVTATALKIVASMKRDWMQTGRKPSGICGAALFISSLSHGFTYSKSDVVKIVHICEATLTKRLVEFENTESGSLTIEEFENIAKDFEKESLAPANPDSGTQEIEMLCQHKGKQPHFAHGLCQDCYKNFIELSGGLNGGSEPPAFQQAEFQRLSQSSNQDVVYGEDVNQDIQNSSRSSTPKSIPTPATEKLHEFCEEKVQGDENAPGVSDESDNLSDIDDIEVNCYLNSEVEKHFKTIIWEEMNKEYIQEQRAKEEAIAAAYEDIGDVSDDVLAAKKLAAAAQAAVAKTRELRRQKRALESMNAGPAKTPAEATRQMLTKKGLSSKINYDVLENLFDETPVISAKKSRTESYDDGNASGQEGHKEEHEAKSVDYKETEDSERYTEDYENAEYYNGNGEEMYNYDDNNQENWDDY